MAIFTKKITQKVAHHDEEIFDDEYERRFYLFGIPIFKHTFDAKHSFKPGHKHGASTIGFTKDNNK